ncbi:antibiotic biosynthesis monooxygenase [Planctomycetota bacterium]
MIVTCVRVKVDPEHVDDFIEACRPNHLGSVAETGNFRFDVCQSQDDPTSFLLYEAYETAEAAARHKETDHYKSWRETVADWMAEPRRGVRFDILFPAQ